MIAAREACEHGEFVRLFKGSENAVAEPVPFGIHTADRLMAIAAKPAIADCAHAHTLPQSWATLYELTKLDDAEITTRIEAGEITPDMTRAQAVALRADPVERPEQAIHEAMAAALKNAVTKFVGKLTTREQFAYVLNRLDAVTQFVVSQQAEIAGEVFAVRETTKTRRRAAAASTGKVLKHVSTEQAAIGLFDTMREALRGECADADCAATLHEHWVCMGQQLFSDFSLCRVRAEWREKYAGDIVRDAAAFAAGVQGRPAKVFRQLNAVARRIVRQMVPQSAF